MPTKKTYVPDLIFQRTTRSNMANNTNGAENGVQAGTDGRPFNLTKFDSNIRKKFDPKTTDAHTGYTNLCQ